MVQYEIFDLPAATTAASPIESPDFTPAHAANLDAAIGNAKQSLIQYGSSFDNWTIAWSGGKDSTTAVTLICWLIRTGQITAPKKLFILFSNTYAELPPLAEAAAIIRAQLEQIGFFKFIEVAAEPAKRLYANILGRGVSPPTNNTNRWCTRQTKVDPMVKATQSIVEQYGPVLQITGVRAGESAARDKTISISCTKEGGECGQSRFQQEIPTNKKLRGMVSALDPLLTWKTCHVWDWLTVFAPGAEYGGFNTAPLAWAYGVDEDSESTIRTGCLGCPLVTRDRALDMMIAKNPALAPLAEIHGILQSLREPSRRHRKDPILDNYLTTSNRLGASTLISRLVAIAKIQEIEQQTGAQIIDDDSLAAIKNSIENGEYPNGWSGNEIRGDEPFNEISKTGEVQFDLFAISQDDQDEPFISPPMNELFEKCSGRG